MQCRKYLVKIIFWFICMLNDIQLFFHFIHKFKASQIIFNESFICWICVIVSLTFPFFVRIKKTRYKPFFFTCFHVQLKCFKTSPQQFNYIYRERVHFVLILQTFPRSSMYNEWLWFDLMIVETVHFLIQTILTRRILPHQNCGNQRWRVPDSVRSKEPRICTHTDVIKYMFVIY